jgi:hypothetical protein
VSFTTAETCQPCLKTSNPKSIPEEKDEAMPLVKVKEKFHITIPTALRTAVRFSVGDL